MYYTRFEGSCGRVDIEAMDIQCIQREQNSKNKLDEEVEVSLDDDAPRYLSSDPIFSPFDNNARDPWPRTGAR